MANGISDLQFPRQTNAAQQMVAMLAQNPNALPGGQQVINKAYVDLQKFQLEKQERDNEVIINVLDTVKSQEDLPKAEQALVAYFGPESQPSIRQKIQMIAPYNVIDPKVIEALKASLLKVKDKISIEKNKLLGEKNEINSEVNQTARDRLEFDKTKPIEKKYDIFESGEQQQYIEKGQPIPKGAKAVKGKGITINTGKVGKATQTKLEQDIIAGVQSVKSFQETKKLFKPEYLTWYGKGEKGVAEFADKAGMSTEKQKKLIDSRQGWFRRAKSDFIAYRKWATGVAGGKEELAEIATSFPDPVKNSPQQYISNVGSIEQTTKEVLMINKEFLKSGIDVNQPLSAIFNEIKQKGLNIEGLPGSGGGGETIVIRFDAQGNQIQ